MSLKNANICGSFLGSVDMYTAANVFFHSLSISARRCDESISHVSILGNGCQCGNPFDSVGRGKIKCGINGLKTWSEGSPTPAL